MMGKPEAVKCPSCGGKMVSRANRQSGQRFWGCADYPRCKGTLNTDGEASGRYRADDNDEADDRYPGQKRGLW
jgi:ssDNA-binding Zn-finger/Zn-ribbon topoisomerase 1